MSNNKVGLKDLNDKKIARDISKEIVSFGVTESQKIEIMMNLAMTLEDNESLKEIVNFLKKYTFSFNKEENDNIIESKPDKILIS